MVGSDLGSDSDQRHPGDAATIGGASDSDSTWDERETQSQHGLGTKSKIVVVGAGPVGALAAIYAADRGFEVEVYELRNGNDIIYYLSSMNIRACFCTRVLCFFAIYPGCQGYCVSWQDLCQSHFENSRP